MPGGSVSRAVVLIVEDEALLRLNAATMLKDLGYEVVLAVSAEQAIEILERDASIRVVFSDVDLGAGMNGLLLAETIRDRWPPVELIVTSGHEPVDSRDLPERTQFLPKPYSESDLRQAFATIDL
jgi:CheY-like chemotaxis protein